VWYHETDTRRYDRSQGVLVGQGLWRVGDAYYAAAYDDEADALSRPGPRLINGVALRRREDFCGAQDRRVELLEARLLRA